MYYLSKSDIDEMVLRLVQQIKDSGKQFDCIVGIENGGIHISIPIAHALGLPHRSVRISCYDGKQMRESPIVLSGDIKGNILLVDDLIDSGSTITLFKKHFGHYDGLAVLLWKKAAGIVPDFYISEKPNEWVVFYWEK